MGLHNKRKGKRMNITKVSIKDNKATIGLIGEDDGTSTRNPQCEVPISLIAALQKLAPAVCDICGFPPDYAKGMAVSGLSLSHVEGIVGAVITVKKALLTSQSPFCFSTPHLSESPYGGRLDYSQCLPEYVMELIEQVIRESVTFALESSKRDVEQLEETLEKQLAFKF